MWPAWARGKEPNSDLNVNCVQSSWNPQLSKGFTQDSKVGKRWLPKLEGHCVFGLKLHRLSEEGCRWFGANIPSGVLTPLPGSGKMWRKSFGTKQANKHTPKQNSMRSPTPKTFHLQTCFCHCQRFRIATFGRLWPQTQGLCSFPKAPKIKNSLWQKQYVCKQKGFIFEKLNSPFRWSIFGIKSLRRFSICFSQSGLSQAGRTVLFLCVVFINWVCVWNACLWAEG